jgi:cell division protein FtsW (lipid II flippase)
MIWGVLLLIMGCAVVGVVAWYFSRRQVRVTGEGEQWHLARQAVAFSTAVGVAILAAGVFAFVKTGYNWLVLGLVWAVGLLHLGLLAGFTRKARKTIRRAQPSR